MDKIWALEALAEQQQAEITAMQNVLFSLQKEVGTASEAARIKASETRCALVDVRDEIKHLNHKFSVIFTDMVEIKRLLAPLREEKEKQEALAKARAEIEAAERTIAEAKKVIANGGEEEGYW